MMMTVGDLKKQLEKYSDELEIVLSNDSVISDGIYGVLKLYEEETYLYIDPDYAH